MKCPLTHIEIKNLDKGLIKDCLIETKILDRNEGIKGLITHLRKKSLDMQANGIEKFCGNDFCYFCY
jgi:hypothetical protein